MNTNEINQTKNKIFETLQNSSFNDEQKNVISNIVISLKNSYPEIDLNNIYHGLSFNQGIIFAPERFKPWWGAFYSSPRVIDTKGTLEQGYICFRSPSEIDFSNGMFFETFVHEMIHSFTQEMKKNDAYSSRIGLGFYFDNINELFTDYYATQVTIDSGFSYAKSRNTFYSNGNKLSIDIDTPGYSSFTFYGKLLDYMYRDIIVSDMFNHTNYLSSDKLKPLFSNFDSAIKDVLNNPSVETYSKANKAISLIASNYLQENIKNLSLEKYLEFRELYIKTMPYLNDVRMDKQSVDSFDEFFYTNYTNKNVVNNKDDFNNFKTKLLFIEEFGKDCFDFNSMRICSRKNSETGNIDLYVISDKNDEIYFLKLDKNNEVLDSVTVVAVPDDLVFESLGKQNKNFLTKFKPGIKLTHDDNIDSKSFDEILCNKDSFHQLAILQNKRNKEDSFEKTVLSIAYNKSFNEYDNYNYFEELLRKNTLKDSTGKNSTYLLLEGINVTEKTFVFISNSNYIAPFFEKDYSGKDFIDYALEKNKPEQLAALFSNHQISIDELGVILKNHKDSIYKHPEVFFETIKNLSVTNSFYSQEKMIELISVIDKSIDLKNLKDSNGNNISNYIESSALQINCFLKDISFDKKDYRFNLRAGLIANDISYSEENNNGISAFYNYLNKTNFSLENIGELKMILKNSDVTLNFLPNKLVPFMDSDMLNIINQNHFDLNSPQGKGFSNIVFDNKYVSDDAKLFIYLKNDEIRNSLKGQDFFDKLLIDCMNYNSKEFNGLSDLFSKISDMGYDLNQIVVQDKSIEDFLISQNRFGDIRSLVRDSKLDLFNFDNGDCLYNKLIQVEKEKDFKQIFIEDNFVQKLLSDEDNNGLTYIQRVVNDSNLSLQDKLEKIDYLKQIGFDFNKIESNGLDCSFFIKNDESPAIIDYLTDNGYNVWNRTEKGISYAEVMVVRRLSESLGVCASKDAEFVDKLFEKENSLCQIESLFDMMVRKKDYDSMACIIYANENMLDKILESDNVQRFEVLKNVVEKYPDLLDSLVQRESFNNLDDMTKTDIFINKGSIDKLFREDNFEGLSIFAEMKPSCISYIKEHVLFEDSPEQFKNEVLNLDENKTVDIDVIEKYSRDLEI